MVTSFLYCKGAGILKKVIVFTLAAILAMSLFGCGKPQKQKFTAYYFDWFDTATTVTGYEYAEEDFKKVTSEIEALFDKYHRLYNIYLRYEGINNFVTVNETVNGVHSVVEVEKEIIDLVNFSREMYTLTDGKFNIAMGSVLSIWHTYRELGMSDPENAELPPMDKLIEASHHTDIDDLIIDEATMSLHITDGKMKLDVGAIAKGYACEQVARYLEEKGVSGYIINAGGNIRAVGAKPDGEKWTIGLENPDITDEEKPYIAYLALTNESLVTSGSYQRYYAVDGKNYHHIIDPETLMPSERYLSVSVICPDSGMGDALSTALFNMDYSEGSALISSLSDVEALWVLPSGEIIQSEGFKQFITE